MCTLPCLQETMDLCRQSSTSNEWKECYNSSNEKCMKKCMKELKGETNDNIYDEGRTHKVLDAAKKLKEQYTELKTHQVIVNSK